MEQMHFVGMCGSLRKESYNKIVLQAAMELLPEGVTMEIAEIGDLPLYNADLDTPAAAERPASVTRLREQLSRAQGIVLVCPEYNYSIPGTIKNAIDWASRGQDSPVMHKAVCVMGATNGMWGTVRMHTAWRPVFTFLNMFPVNKPEVLIAQVASKISEGKLTDEMTRNLIRQQLEALRQLALKIS